jgi:long-chain acyl-CoA synthetase
MIVEHLLTQARTQSDETAVIDDHGRYTFRQVAGAALATVGRVAAATQRPNVGLMLPSGMPFVAGFYGILMAGRTVVPINFLLGPREVAHVLADSGVDAVISTGPLATRLGECGVRVIDPVGEAIPENASPAAPLAGPAQMPARSGADLAVLMYTSGTSGLPKGVRLTFANLQSDVDAAIAAAAFKKRHRFLGVIPLFHAFGMMAMMLAPIQLGTAVIYMSRFSAAGALKAIREEHASVLFGVPSMFGAILHLKSATPADFAGTYALISGAEPLPAGLRDAFLGRFGVPILEGYGLTETSPAVALNVPQDSRPGSVGRMVPGAEVRIGDEHDRAAPVGECGQVLLRGPMVFDGYHNLPEATAAAFTPDRFFRTGDIGRVDADGYLYITGRLKDLIIVAGEKAAPREIEDVLMRHASVAEAAVLGKKDSARGEVVVAFVTARLPATPKAEELREFCRSEGLPQWKIPREVFVVEELPRSPTGKVLKRSLAERLAGGAGGVSGPAAG